MSSGGKYIVIEGHDGTGKSTQVAKIRERLSAQGIDSIEFHEPQGTPVSDAIRTLIKNGELERDGITNMLLFNAARHDIWNKLALPAIDNGTWVIASRNYFSTLAYQGYGEGLDIDLISSITKSSTDKRYMKPDLTVILDMDDEKERSKRIKARGELENPDTFESKDSDFQIRVKDAYLEIAKDRDLRVISASQSPEVITDEIWAKMIDEFDELSDSEQESALSLSPETA